MVPRSPPLPMPVIKLEASAPAGRSPAPPTDGRPWSGRKTRKKNESREADDGDRIRDQQLGKLMLYQLSYVRAPAE